MKYSYQKTSARLAQYVQTILVFDNNSHGESSDLPLFTKGMPALLCKTENNNNSITIFGQSVPDEKWTVEGKDTLIAFLFKPFSIGAIFKVPAKKLKEQPIELPLWNAQNAMALNLQLAHATSLAERMEILDHFIFTQIQNNQRECDIIRYATDSLMQNPNTDSLPQLLQDLNLTERTFQRIFKSYVGITASEYRRVCQFYFAFLQLKGGHFEKLTDVAYDNGYFDQSHYIRSFKGFTDTTPGEYLAAGLPRKDE